MSRETVYALTRFTAKLQKAAAEDELVLPDPSTGDNQNALPPRGVSPGPGLVPNVTKPPKAFSMKAYDAANAAPAPEGKSWMDALAGLGQYMPSMPVLGGIGLGGLGAYGLARAMRSKKDEEENNFPWLATALGMGGGGALAAYLASQGAPTVLPNAPGSDYALHNPSALPATGGRAAQRYDNIA